MDELTFAVDTGDTETVKSSLDENDFTRSVMANLLTRCLTATNFNKEIMELVLKTGVDPDMPGEKREIIVIGCGRVHHTHGQNCERRYHGSKYPLLLATQLANIEAVKLLLEYGANVDKVDVVSGWTALYSAVMQFNIRLVEILLSYGALPNKKVINATPFTFLLGNIYTSITSEAREREKILCLMLNHGANANAVLSYNGFSTMTNVPALIKCIYSHVSFEAVNEMVKRVADVDSKDDRCNSALSKSVSFGRADLVQLLLDYGSNPNLRMTTSGHTCLMEAVRNKNISVTKLLVEAGADINAEDVWRNTALSHAVETSNTEAIALLIRYNVKFYGLNPRKSPPPFAPDHYSDLIAFACFAMKNEDIYRLLFLAGAGLENIAVNNDFKEGPNPGISKILVLPVPLKQLCRTIVRQRLSHEIQTEINHLPLPQLLKDYILIPETKQYLTD